MGRLGEPKTLIFLRFFNVFCKIEVSNKNGHLGRFRSDLGASWSDLGASWDALGAPRRPPGGAHRFKEDPGRVRAELFGTPPSLSN